MGITGFEAEGEVLEHRGAGHRARFGLRMEDPADRPVVSGDMGGQIPPGCTARRHRLGAAARRTVEDEYGWERVIDQVEATYETVLQRRVRHSASPAAQSLGVLEA